MITVQTQFGKVVFHFIHIIYINVLSKQNFNFTNIYYYHNLNKLKKFQLKYSKFYNIHGNSDGNNQKLSHLSNKNDSL